jgi:DNA-binding response OmpR family regulator
MAEAVTVPICPVCPRCGYDMELTRELVRGRFRYSPEGGLQIDGERLKLEHHCELLIGALMTQPGRGMTYDAIEQRLKARWQSPSNSVSVLLTKIRLAFRQVGVECPIARVWGRGLRWVDDD